MKKSGIKALCLIVGMGLSGLTVMVQATTVEQKGALEKSSEVMKSSVPKQKLEKAIIADSDEDEVNINTATAEQLAAIMNGVGLKKAQAIVTYREQNGPFTQIEQLQEVPGIGAALVGRNLSRLKL
ncbi:competence protein ComEA [Prodigiosinella confusarubida]|uniref:Competence protein ComEA n=1 Tax=Serratia sp. (strain ATCC 39006) TaxID=104623 RepID=A0A2I5TAV3_SERS3|nr:MULTISPECIES: helix-hairpin-helix domain-containing protein [Enterobacterales]AUH01693.1 competence protein ComEA [Serratia sp. ATCC 39006]AUH06016.1 competence protein ComEA [Serratia sp. ATCC 39006]